MSAVLFPRGERFFWFATAYLLAFLPRTFCFGARAAKTNFIVALIAHPLLPTRHACATTTQSSKVYKFVGVNVSHPEFIKRYGRLGPRELSKSAGQGDEEVDAIACTKLADHLLVRNRHDPDSKSKYEVGRTKIFIRCVYRRWHDLQLPIFDCVSKTHKKKHTFTELIKRTDVIVAHLLTHA